MPKFVFRSKWMRSVAFVHVLVRSYSCPGFVANTWIQKGRRHQSLSVNRRYDHERAFATECRPRNGGRSRTLRMAELYKDEAEARFYAQRLQDLITAYALKTANHYWMELRGNMYAEWLARYIDNCGGIESIGWHAFLSGMLRAPPEDIVVRKLVKRPRGGSGTNPYLSDRKPVEYNETIEPVTIARRIMDIREQMAEQLSADLRQMPAENQKLERNYADEVELGTERAEQLQLITMEPTVDIDPSSGMANPPQRRATYKGAIELVTSASLRRVQGELRIRGDRRTLEWLERFTERKLDVRGNALIMALLKGPMVLINDPGRARPEVIEPLKVAKAIMHAREVIADELASVLEEVPRDHLQLTVSLLNEKWHSPGDIEAGEPEPRET